jgi:hypothetical protein
VPIIPEMTIDENRKYLMRQQVQYEKAKRKEKSHLLDDMMAMTGLNRKYLIQLMGSNLQRKPRQRQRGATYGPKMQAVLEAVAESLDFVCGKRLKPVLLETARDLQRHGELELDADLEQALAKISISTIDRRLPRHRPLDLKLPRKRPSSSKSKVQQAVPISTIPWDESEPGHFEVDLVHHSGPDASGDFVYTLQMIDVATGWSERYAILGKSWVVMEEAFRILQQRLPFPVIEIHTDNGSEFLNAHLYRFWSEQSPTIKLSRSRPSYKNDARFVEQKNSTLVRAYLQDKRYDTVAQVKALNCLFELMGIFYNLFQPVMRLEAKCWSTDELGSPKLKRTYGPAATPLQRLLATGILNPMQAEAIQHLRYQTNVRALHKQIWHQLFQVKLLPNALPGEQQNVYHTLTDFLSDSQKGDWQPRLDYHLTQQQLITYP